MKRREWAAMSVAFLAAGISRWSAAQAPSPTTAHPQTAAADTSKAFTAAELDELLAPIALYPDALLSQALMAATCPLEVVEAGRWSKNNPNLTGDAALAAAKDKGWVSSVASLVAFPQVPAMIDTKLEWTQKVGDAMISQQPDVAESIQRLRAQALAAGTLKTTPQQTVSSQPASAGAPEGTPGAIVIRRPLPIPSTCRPTIPMWLMDRGPTPAIRPATIRRPATAGARRGPVLAVSASGGAKRRTRLHHQGPHDQRLRSPTASSVSATSGRTRRSLPRRSSPSIPKKAGKRPI